MNLLNISIDDVTPNPLSSTDVIDSCERLASVFTDIKFTLFVPTAYWRTVPSPRQSMNSSPLFIDEHREFCEKLLSLDERRYELCFHGHFHGVLNVSNNDEFKNLDEKDSVLLYNAMFETAKRANLYDKMRLVIRPPAWRMSPESIRVGRALGIKCFALSSDDYAKITYGGEDEKSNDVVYYACAPPIKPLVLTKKTEIVYHASKWDSNYLDEQKLEELEQFLERNRKEFKFSFIEDLI